MTQCKKSDLAMHPDGYFILRMFVINDNDYLLVVLFFSNRCRLEIKRFRGFG